MQPSGSPTLWEWGGEDWIPIHFSRKGPQEKRKKKIIQPKSLRSVFGEHKGFQL